MAFPTFADVELSYLPERWKPMHKTMKRWISLLLAAVMSLSLLVLPAGAAAESPAGETQETSAATVTIEDFLNPQPVEEIEEEVPLVNIIEAVRDLTGESESSDGEEPAPEDGDALPDEAVLPGETEEPSGGETLPDEEQEEPAEESPAETLEGEETGETLLTASGEAESFTVSYYNGSALLSQETVLAGGTPAAVPAANGDGEAISGWLNAGGSFAVPGEAVITGDTVYYAWYAPALEMEAHNRYINGYGDAMFAPENLMTRAQAATILYNLMVSKERGAYEVSFSDVPEGSWYYEPIMTLASYRVLSGYGDGTFCPENSVTRAEFVTMLVRIFGMEEGEISFSDVSQNGWEAPYVATAVANGWVLGYEDGTFRPYNGITRAEAVVIVNRVLNRVCDEETVANGEGILRYLDVSPGAWYYPYVMEASIAHTYTRTATGEKWTNYTVESCGLEPGLQTVYDKLYYVSGTTKQLVPVKAGLNEIEGGWYYAAADGYAIDAVLKTEELSQGFNMVAGYNALFYWDGAAQGARYLTKGINKIDGTAYYANEDGYIINNTFFGGIVELDGKLYIAGDYCNIITTYYDYTSGKGVEKDLAESTYEYQKNMYYLKEDYSLARDEWIGYLYFDKNGRYTTGDATLDAYVYNVVSSFIDNNALTQEQKLLKVYYHFRGYDGKNAANPVGSSYSYWNWGQGFARQRYNSKAHISWLQNCAKVFFSTKRGSCYNWAAAYLYCARRLGFQSYAVVGNLERDREEWEDARHCWCMIYWGGKWHISDVETEWGYLNRYYASTSMYYNLFAQTLATENVTYYENPERPAICYFFKNEG